MTDDPDTVLGVCIDCDRLDVAIVPMLTCRGVNKGLCLDVDACEDAQKTMVNTQ